MKRHTLMLVMLFSILSISAQTIQNKSKWFDGEVLWTATVSGNSVEMTGMSATPANTLLATRIRSIWLQDCVPRLVGE